MNDNFFFFFFADVIFSLSFLYLFCFCSFSPFLACHVVAVMVLFARPWWVHYLLSLYLLMSFLLFRSLFLLSSVLKKNKTNMQRLTLVSIHKSTSTPFFSSKTVWNDCACVSADTHIALLCSSPWSHSTCVLYWFSRDVNAHHFFFPLFYSKENLI